MYVCIYTNIYIYISVFICLCRCLSVTNAGLPFLGLRWPVLLLSVDVSVLLLFVDVSVLLLSVGVSVLLQRGLASAAGDSVAGSAAQGQATEAP